MRTIHTILREDFGPLDRQLIRKELLAESGIEDVACESARNRLTIEYDPKVLNDLRLLDILYRCGVMPAPGIEPEDGARGGDG
jgi:hypothetical protein